MARLTKISTSQRYNWLGRGRLSISTALSDIQGPRGAYWFGATRLLARKQEGKRYQKGREGGERAWLQRTASVFRKRDEHALEQAHEARIGTNRVKDGIEKYKR